MSEAEKFEITRSVPSKAHMGEQWLRQNGYEYIVEFPYDGWLRGNAQSYIDHITNSANIVHGLLVSAVKWRIDEDEEPNFTNHQYEVWFKTAEDAMMFKLAL